MVVQSPLDFNLLLGHVYTYVMGVLVSSLFCVICFQHEGKIVAIDQLWFVCPNINPSLPSFLNGLHTQVASFPPEFNYVETCSMPTSSDGAMSDVMNCVLEALYPDF